jgi:two-component system response regulator FixJ
MSSEGAIALIDDDEDVRETLRALLQARGYSVTDYASAETFLAECDKDVVECVLVDIHMPGISGLELQTELARRKFASSVIVMTGQGAVPLAVAAMKAGAFDFIEKPFDRDTLLDNIRRAVCVARNARATATQAKAAQQRLALLTPRERDVFNNLALGKSSKVVASDLQISPRTVEVHRSRVMEKLNARDVSDLVGLAGTANRSA